MKYFFTIYLSLFFTIHSNIIIAQNQIALTKSEINSLATVCRIWGLMKYNHPALRTHRLDADSLLTQEILPKIKKIKNTKDFNHYLSVFLSGLKTDSLNVEKIEKELLVSKIKAGFVWIEQNKMLDRENKARLWKIIYCSKPKQSYYVEQDSLGYVSFMNEKNYDLPKQNPSNVKLLSLFRIWNVLDLFYPYKKQLDNEWEEVLKKQIPIFNNEDTSLLSYKYDILRFSTFLQDQHGFIDVPEIKGSVYANFYPIVINDTLIVIDKYCSIGFCNEMSNIEKGDIILSINGKKVKDFKDKYKELISGGRSQTIDNEIALTFVTAFKKINTYEIIRKHQKIIIEHEYLDFTIIDSLRDFIKEKYKGIVTEKYLYLDGTLINRKTIKEVLEANKAKKYIIIDNRFYCKDYHRPLANFIFPTKTKVEVQKIANLDFAGLWEWNEDCKTCNLGTENPNPYQGKIIVLMDATSQSASEYNIKVLKKAPNVTLIGMPSAGIDGDVTEIILPGNVIFPFTCIGTYFPNRESYQRVGIQPDIYVPYTVKGLHEGKDEILEAALKYIESLESEKVEKK